MASVHTPFQYSIQIIIDNKPIDYLLTVDVTGHVYEAKPAIFELPAMAQKLILSDADEMLEKKIHAFARLIRYILPLTLAGWMESYQEEFAPLVQEINVRLNEKGLKWKDLYHHAIVESVASSVLELFSPDKRISQKQRYSWQRFARAFPNSEGQVPRYYLLSTSEELPMVAEDFLPAVIPFLKPSSRLGAYGALGNIKTEAIKTFLLSELESLYARSYSNHIFKALKGYPPTDVQLCDAAMQFYRRTNRLRERSVSILLDVLMEHPSHRTRAFAIEILKKNSRYSAVHAARALLKMGVPPHEVTDIAIPLFMAADPKLSEASFSILAIEALPAKHLPKAKKVLNIMVETLSKRHNPNIIYALPPLAYKTGLYRYADKICRLLEHEASAVREGMLRLIRDAFQMKDVDIRPFVKEKMLKKYLALAGDINQAVAQSAITLIGIICKGKRMASYIDPLLEVYKQKSKVSVKLEILKAINSILLVIDYPPQIEPIYLEALKNDDSRFRFEALRGLRFSPDNAFKKTLEEYKNDTDELVKKQAEHLYNLPSKTSVANAKKENKWWDIITKSHGKS